MYKINDIISKCRENEFKTEELDQIMESYHLMTDKFGESTEYHAQSSMHYLNVAGIIADLNADSTSIIAALLHGFTSKEDIELVREKYGDDIANIIDNLEKISHLKLTDYSVSGSNNLKKLLVGLSEDVRVLIIKLADRLDVMRHAYILSPEEQKQKATATMEVYVPVVHRLGINSIKSELENLCLKYTKPDMYEEIEHKLNGSTEELAKSLNEMKESISDILTEHGIKFEIKARVKSIYSIYHKLTTGHKWNEIYDILAMRLIVPTEEDCYLAIGLIHAKYRPVPKRFKDYIAMPKANMYQSLHTTVFGVDGHLFEVQFRTFEMDEFAEKGMASHWSYKEHGTKKVQNLMEQKLEMFRNLIETSEEADDVTFENNVTSDILAEMIYVFTPKGDVVELPRGATPIDFAYRIHSDVGDKTVGAIVNDVIVPLNHELDNNDIVKIKTNSASTPNKDWLNFVKTSQAKNKIKSYFSKQERIFMIEKGKDILEKEVRKRKLAFNDVMSEENVKKILKDLKLKDIEEIYLSIGTLRYTAGYMISLTKLEKDTVEDVLIEKVNNHPREEKSYKNDIIVAGIGDVLVNIAKCCKPVKGDAIVGFITKGQGITVHKKFCSNIAGKEERMIDVSWNLENETTYLTDLYIETFNDKNYLTDIIAAFTKRNLYIDAFKTKEFKDAYQYEMTLKVKNKEEIDRIILDLDMLPFVVSVKRSK